MFDVLIGAILIVFAGLFVALSFLSKEQADKLNDRPKNGSQQYE